MMTISLKCKQSHGLVDNAWQQTLSFYAMCQSLSWELHAHSWHTLNNLPPIMLELSMSALLLSSPAAAPLAASFEPLGSCCCYLQGNHYSVLPEKERSDVRVPNR